ncbi:MAG: EutN/CcmL family microcompartment protein [Spirochaetota bacterium]
MKLGRVTGSVVCERKADSFEGIKLLLVQPIDEYFKDAGEMFVACDTVQAGVGDIVIFEGGREAALCLDNWYNPSDATIMGIVDSIDVDPSQGE